VPKLWKDTVEAHRRDVRAAILEAAWILAQERGIRGVTMGLVAENAGISRATLYKYFPGVEEILLAAHEDHVAQHLAALAAARADAASPREALLAMLSGYARIRFHRDRAASAEVHGLVHAGPQHARNSSAVHNMFTEAMQDAQAAAQMRNDLGARDLAAFAVGAFDAAATVSDEPALERLVRLVAEALHLARPRRRHRGPACSTDRAEAAESVTG
jgi:AcrR family transcriptional regulator